MVFPEHVVPMTRVWAGFAKVISSPFLPSSAPMTESFTSEVSSSFQLTMVKFFRIYSFVWNLESSRLVPRCRSFSVPSMTFLERKIQKFFR